MKRILVLTAVLASACGSVTDRAECTTSPDCPAGQYCSQTPDGNVCWPDADAPQVTSVTASCAGGCRRDSRLVVTAAIADATSGVLDASVSLDLPGGPAVPMTRSGTIWQAEVDLRQFPFEHFARDVAAAVTARDGARNESAPRAAAPVGVTRLRWERLVDLDGAVLSPTSPAVAPDGTIVVGGSNGKLYFVKPDGTNAHPPLTVGAGQLTAAPAIGQHAIWVGSEDFSLYAVELDGSAVKAGVGVNVGGAIEGSVAVLPSGAKEWGFATSAAGFVGAASTVAGEDAVTGPTTAFSVGPVVGADSRIFAATSAGSATLRAFTLTTQAITLSELWSVSVGVNVSAPTAIDGEANVWTATVDGKLGKTAPGATSGTVTTVATLPGSIVDSPVVLANGDVVVGDDTGLLHRYSPAGAQQWTTEPNLGAAVQSPLVLAGSSTPLVVPSAGGRLFAVRGDGTVAWSATLEAGKALRAPNIGAPAGQPGAVTSTAYLTNAGGKLFAVIVDGQLDASAPWPKAFHDPRNTNRAGPQP